jgi:glycosyltransferase involved in cell wall biosynthesis
VPAWKCLAIDDPKEQASYRQYGSVGLVEFKRRARRTIDTIYLLFRPDYARKIYWRLNPCFNEIYKLARVHRADFWLANDWTVLPIASRLAAEQGVRYGYDAHEFAADEYRQSRLWRITQRPIITAIEKDGIAGAAFTTCVSDGIAKELTSTYGLRAVPKVIRSTPIYSPGTFRPTGGTIEVLYHGIVASGRGLDECIRSVALWRPEFRLTIRGPSKPEYLAMLRKIAESSNVSGRVIFEGPVPMTQLVARAASFDIGLFALPDYSSQNIYVLPNKFFEYVMAGLALCVSDLPEMSRLLQHYNLGVSIDSVTPEAIAVAVNKLDRRAIDAYKRNALEAAKELNWEAEGNAFLQLCEASVSERIPAH